MTANLPDVVHHGAGLVVMLDAAGRTIDQLERQVNRLTEALEQERRERLKLAALLESLRQAPDAAYVPPSDPIGDHHGTHDRHDTPTPA